jgi:hypothetical protein
VIATRRGTLVAAYTPINRGGPHVTAGGVPFYAEGPCRRPRCPREWDDLARQEIASGVLSS